MTTSRIDLLKKYWCLVIVPAACAIVWDIILLTIVVDDRVEIPGVMILFLLLPWLIFTAPFVVFFQRVLLRLSP